jgi:ribonuclease HII
MVDKEFDLQYVTKYRNVVGIDEVGRGALAGPVVAAAVKLDEWIDGIDDSKKLSAKKREQMVEKIVLNAQVAFGMATPTEIDIYNILGATKLAMQRAYDNLSIQNTQIFALIDGLEMGFNFPHESVIKGDEKSPSIAAASIAAKVFRDTIMKKISPFFAGYGFEHNVGYATRQHLQAIKERGPTLFHRLTFAPVEEALSIELLEKWRKAEKISPQRLQGKTFHLFSN